MGVAWQAAGRLNGIVSSQRLIPTLLDLVHNSSYDKGCAAEALGALRETASPKRETPMLPTNQAKFQRDMSTSLRYGTEIHDPIISPSTMPSETDLAYLTPNPNLHFAIP